jgi:hypothetical protein
MVYAFGVGEAYNKFHVEGRGAQMSVGYFSFYFQTKYLSNPSNAATIQKSAQFFMAAFPY